MRKIPLTAIINGRKQVSGYALVDDEDYSRVMEYKWHKNIAPHAVYARGNEWTGKGWRGIKMHRLILGLKTGDPRLVDHIDHDGLNNQKSNLRICDKSTNAMNQKIRKSNVSGFKGVFLDKRARGKGNDRRWMAFIGVGKRLHFLGRFSTPEEASKARREAAQKMHGEFAHD